MQVLDEAGHILDMGFSATLVCLTSPLPPLLLVQVLDEADRILDMGFSATLDAILDNLPVERQTMLFSATQTKSIKVL